MKAWVLVGDVGSLPLAVGSFDALISDPPYGLSFMGRKWDHGVPPAKTWKEVLRCLKPGAFLMAFGGTRTFHRLTCAIEDAGTEIRDCMMWLYGQGFVKNHNVSKALDKAAGAEREVVGRTKGCGSNAGTGCLGWNRAEDEVDRTEYDLTLPATPEAQRWDGWGTALSPSWEPVVLARKPLDGTVAHNCVTHGCGALNVDGGRIGTDDGYKTNCVTQGINTAQTSYAPAVGRRTFEPSQNGRWPANVLLSHTPDCRCVGHRKVKGHKGYPHGPGGKSMQYSDDTSRGADVRPNAWPGHADADGTETVEVWDCVPGCPVRLLDEQSGESRAGKDTGRRGTGGMWSGISNHPCGPQYGDTGGASRFFYCAKASRSEREIGLERFTPRNVNDGRKTSIDNPYQRGDTPRRNTHPTVKPIDLCRYLATLLLPPPRPDGSPRRILVPFSGSGSEMIGCLLAGWDEVVGIERDAEYARIARARIARWQELSAGVPVERRDPKKLRERAPDPAQTSLLGLLEEDTP